MVDLPMSQKEGPRSLVERLERRFYQRLWQERAFQWETLRPYRQWALEFLSPNRSVMLDVGAGGAQDRQRSFRGLAGKVVGIDIDDAVLANPGLDEAQVFDGVHIPFPDRSFDVVVSDWTFEHVSAPGPLLQEIARVLKEGGLLVVRTPNLWHYVSLIARVTPYWFHKLSCRCFLGPGQQPRHTFATFYRLNTGGRIKSALSQAGFAQVELRFIEPPPSYLRFNPLLFLLGVLYERAVNKVSALSCLRHTIVFRAVKG